MNNVFQELQLASSYSAPSESPSPARLVRNRSPRRRFSTNPLTVASYANIVNIVKAQERLRDEAGQPRPRFGGGPCRSAAAVRRPPFGGGRGRRRRGDVRTGAPAAARRGAAQRLPADADDRGAQRRAVAPEPGLGLPRARPARGRGPDPRDRARRRQAVRDHRRRPRAARAAATARPPPWEMDDDRRSSRSAEIALADHADRQGRMAGRVRPATSVRSRRARETLAETRRALYRILAEDDGRRTGTDA